MANMAPLAHTIEVDSETRVSALLQAPPDAIAGYIFAHGAGAGMQHRFMAAVADGLAQRRIAVLRYQFPYLERGSRRPDAPALAQATVRAAVETAREQLAGLPLVAGGKSYGARMTTQAQAAQPLPGVRALALLGFPLHPAGKPATTRAQHLAQIDVPMLFVQGTRDALAALDLLRPLLAQLPAQPLLHQIDAADHGFDVLVRSGRNPDAVMHELLDVTAGWIARQAAAAG